MIDFQTLYDSIPFGSELTTIHHVGFILPSNMSNIDLKKNCDKFCCIDVLKANVGYKLYNDILIELIQPKDKSSILFNSSNKITNITFDHFGYLNSNWSYEGIKYVKISKFYTCLFQTDVEFILSNNQKIEIVYDNLQ